MWRLVRLLVICCYEVDAQVIEPLQTSYPDWLGVLQEISPDKGMLDLKKLIWHQILASGVPEHQVERIEFCTRCRDDLFFSYRREGNSQWNDDEWDHPTRKTSEKVSPEKLDIDQ